MKDHAGMVVTNPIPFKEATLVNVGQPVVVGCFAFLSETGLKKSQWQANKYVWVRPKEMPFAFESGYIERPTIAKIIGDKQVELIEPAGNLSEID